MTVDRSKNPSSFLYWNDLENDEHLATCSWAARGLWACKLLPIAARSAEYGVIQIGDNPCRWDDDLPVVLAKASGGATPEIVAMIADGFQTLLTELVVNRAASVDEQGRLYNRRMVREEGIRRARSEAGKAGAEATNAKRQKSGKHLGKGHGKQVGKVVGKIDDAQSTLSLGDTTGISDKSSTEPRQDSGKDAGDPDGKSTPSSLLHVFSTSEEEDLENLTEERVTAPSGDGADGHGEPEAGSEPGSRKARADARGRRLPDGWQPSPEAAQFARDLGLNPDSVIAEFVDYWRGVPGQRGRKIDWDATYRNRCRDIAARRPHGQRTRNGQTAGLDGESPTLAGVSAAFARRSFPDGGRG